MSEIDKRPKVRAFASHAGLLGGKCLHGLYDRQCPICDAEEERALDEFAREAKARGDVLG